MVVAINQGKHICLVGLSQLLKSNEDKGVETKLKQSIEE